MINTSIYHVLICTTGIRKSEGLALQKKFVNLDKGTVFIRHSLAQVYGKSLVLTDPKSETSKRELALPDIAVKALREHLKNQTSESPFVFSTSNGTPFSPHNIIRHFKKKLLEAELLINTRSHDVRHSFISWLSASGVSVKDVQMIAGHAQASTTLEIYSHLLPGYNRQAADKVQGMFESGIK